MIVPRWVQRLREKQSYVKPVMPGGLFGWTVIEATPVESFFDDWKRYGFLIALDNLFVQIAGRTPEKSRKGDRHENAERDQD